MSISVQGISKNFKGRRKGEPDNQVLKDVSFEVNAGEVLGYIGPNGAGKSATIRILLGIIRATQGKVQIFGKDVWQDSIEIHKKIAYVPRDVYLWPNLSGGETIDLFLKLHGASNQEKRDQLIKKFDLNPKKKVRSYSKGNRQKIALIAALATEAELYIFDEPTSGLDPLMEAVFQEEVKALKAAGKAIILSSHILSEVEKLADRVAVIRKGEIVETGTLDDLRHLTRYQYKVETEQEAVGLKELSSVHDLQIKENEATFQADSDAIDEILKTLLLYGVKKLEATPPTLEDLFMRHYQ